MAKSTQEYLPVASDDALEYEDESTACSSRRTILTEVRLSLGGAVLAAVFLLLLGYVSSRLVNVNHCRVAQVYDTEFAPATEVVELEQVLFTASPSFDENGDPLLLDYPPDQPRYVGLPVGDVDKAWRDLIRDRYFVISDEEAAQAWGPDYKQYYRYPDFPNKKGGYIAGLDVLHTLHCVNKLRLELYKDHYPAKKMTAFRQYHIDHCLEIIRQAIQCNGDLTPIPSRWWPGLKDHNGHGRAFIDTSLVHTCRNFTKVREWTDSRIIPGFYSPDKVMFPPPGSGITQA